MTHRGRGRGVVTSIMGISVRRVVGGKGGGGIERRRGRRIIDKRQWPVMESRRSMATAPFSSTGGLSMRRFIMAEPSMSRRLAELGVIWEGDIFVKIKRDP